MHVTGLLMDLDYAQAFNRETMSALQKLQCTDLVEDKQQLQTRTKGNKTGFGSAMDSSQ